MASTEHEAATAMPTNGHSTLEQEKAGASMRKEDVESTGSDPVDEKMTFKKIMALIAMAFLWTGSQIPLYLYGGIPPYIYGDLGGADRWTWFILGGLFAFAAVCPFVGSLSDLFGRRYAALFGTALLILGNIVSATAHSMNVFICGMTLSGAAAGLCELVSLAVTSELAPTRKRGVYVSALLFTILPFCPSVLWAQLIAAHSSWRYIGLLCGVWAFIGFVLTAIFYHPPPRINTVGMSKKEVLRRVDYVGGFLSIGGFLMFMAALEWGGYQYEWTSAHVLAPLFIGAVMFIGFIVYEVKWAKYPMVPKHMAREPRILTLTLVITFISGSAFFCVIMFWPTQSYNVYGHDPLEIGIRNLALGFPILFGACIVLILLSVTRGHIRLLMLGSSIMMTAGSGALAGLNRDNVWVSYIALIIGGLGIGGIVVPASIITAIICPDELIATVTALTLSIRVLGGAIGYAIYYNVFSNHFAEKAMKVMGPVCFKVGVTQPPLIKEIVELTSAGLLEKIKEVPGIDGNEQKWEAVVRSGQELYAQSYPYVYYVSLAFGGVAIICSAFLGHIKDYMTDHVAVNYDAKTPQGQSEENH